MLPAAGMQRAATAGFVDQDDWRLPGASLCDGSNFRDGDAGDAAGKRNVGPRSEQEFVILSAVQRLPKRCARMQRQCRGIDHRRDAGLRAKMIEIG